MRMLVAMALLLTLAACQNADRGVVDEEASGQTPAYAVDTSAYEVATDPVLENEEGEDTALQDAATEEAPAQESGDASADLSFEGYPCTVDCSGHEAGYRWAEEHGIDDPSSCGGNSQSFIEGCRAYAKTQQDDAGTEADEDGEEPTED